MPRVGPHDDLAEDDQHDGGDGPGHPSHSARRGGRTAGGPRWPPGRGPARPVRGLAEEDHERRRAPTRRPPRYDGPRRRRREPLSVVLTGRSTAARLDPPDPDPLREPRCSAGRAGRLTILDQGRVSPAVGSPRGVRRFTGGDAHPVRGGRPPAHLRHHQPPRRGQDHPHREVPALRRRPPVGRRGEGPRRAPAGHLGLDGDGAEARHLHHLDGAAVPVPRLACSTCSTPPATATSPRTPTGCWPPPTPPSWCSTPPRASSRRPSSSSRCAASGTCRCSPSSTSGTGPGREPLELLDQIEAQLSIVPTPVTWPVGIAGDFRGVVDRRTGDYVRFTRTARGATEAGEEVLPPRRRPRAGGRRVDGRGRRARAARRGRRPRRRRSASARARSRRCSSARRSPTSACGCCSTRWSTWRRRPSPATTSPGCPAPLDAPFSAFVFKVQANMDPSPPRPHRLRAGVLGPLRAGHGRHPRPHRQALRHQVRPLGVRPGARHDRGGVAGRRDRPGQRHRRHGRRRALPRRAGRVPPAARVRARALRRSPA